jgi:phage tail sheath protein FI
MAFNIGVNVIEVDGSAAPTVVSAPISTAGFLVFSLRGVPNTPVHVQGFSDFVTNFGTYTANAFGAYAVRGFFDCGGSDAYVVRIAAASAVAAKVTLNDRAGAPTLKVTAGMRGQADPGAWANSLAVTIADHPHGLTAIPAQVLGAATEPFALADGQTLAVTVNGGAVPVTVTFKSADFANIAAASAAEIAASILKQTSSVRAGVTPGRALLLASAVSGPASRLDIAGTAATTLGFTAATANTGTALPAGTVAAAVDSTGGLLAGSAVRFESQGSVVAPNAMAASIAAGASIVFTADGGTPVTVTFSASDFVGGVAAITPGEVVASINRQAQGFSAALTQNNRLVLLSNTYGTGSTIALAAPGGGAPDATTAIGLNGASPASGSRQNRSLDSVSESFRMIFWTGGLTVPANSSRLLSAEFDLAVVSNGSEVERFESVTMQTGLDYSIATVVNDAAAGSRYIMVTDLASGSGPGQNAPAVATQQPLTSGADGGAASDIAFTGDPAARSGVFAFDTVRIQLLAVPETTSPGVTTACLTYCANRGDAMFVGTAPFGYDLDGIKTYASPFRGRKVFGALYAPWIQIVNPLDTTGTNPLISVPPVGHVLGMYANIGATRGVFKAPAGDEAVLENALGVEFDMTDTDHTDLVKNGGVNGIRAIPGAGVIVDASRTLSTDTRWLYVSTRRLFNFVKSSLQTSLSFVAQEPHTDDLRRSVKFNVVTPFLLGLWKQGAFGSDPPNTVFTVVCDATNNPPAQVNLGNFQVEVYFYPVKPAETIIIVVGQQDSGSTTAES